MTREEILAGIEIDSDGQEAYTRKEVLQAMSEFAQQEAIAFAEWKDKEGWEYTGARCRKTIKHGRGKKSEYQYATNDELYPLFKQNNHEI